MPRAFITQNELEDVKRLRQTEKVLKPLVRDVKRRLAEGAAVESGDLYPNIHVSVRTDISSTALRAALGEARFAALKAVLPEKELLSLWIITQGWPE